MVGGADSAPAGWNRDCLYRNDIQNSVHPILTKKKTFSFHSVHFDNYVGLGGIEAMRRLEEIFGTTFQEQHETYGLFKYYINQAKIPPYSQK